ncbi:MULTISPECIES: flagellar hook-associated protein FlgK [Alteromonas]|uniref:flagellar hook-associated protein FlgK n=1 Tax=Alteromonas TaxID=226 RepID=UPI0018CB8A43|nr:MULTISPECIES: flagellar hook-associated protein FlgK [Alteromonas]QPL49158.1 flagellar hook-associated protein FlgK [Alteromonas sp. B31-7]|tara:strand:- start:704 stop:2737 length:2034 start_codon:yes stop_codon:yes gene_type:complete
MSVDLFSLATSGVNASSKLLQTTSNNIANVNTDGYVRERTELNNSQVFGVEIGNTERIINVFAQNQLRRDITLVGELESYSSKTTAIDNLLASEANSLSQGISDYFAALQTAADDPTNLASREQVLGKSESLYQRMKTISDYMIEKEEELNLEFTSMVNRANSLIANIGELNKNIVIAKGNSTSDEPSALLNERDQAIDELASIMAINVNDSQSQNGAVTINLITGESLVLDNGAFNLFELNSNGDVTSKELKLETDFGSDTKGDASVPVVENDLGGALGGLFRYRNDVLGPAMRDVGQLSVAFADAMNTQNKLGMDLDGQLGSNIFDIPSFTALTTETGDFQVTGQLIEGKGSELTDADYLIEIDAVDASGVPTSIIVSMINPDGTVQTDGAGNDLVSTMAVSAGYNELPGGIEVEFSGTSNYEEGFQFLLQPTKNIASSITLATQRPEDLAFASPIRAQADATNLGSANVSGVEVTNTTVGDSGFDGSGGLISSAPAQVYFTAEDTYEVLDASGTTLATVTGTTNLNNLLAQAGLTSDPGYDFSLDGVPKAGDSFSISYNTDGFNDNTNTLALASLQNDPLVQVSSESSNTPRTFQDAYASMVGRIGEDAAMANVSLESAEAMKVQSENWFESVSGVSLDEEAANLIKYQQSYAAAARILSTAQELFNTILQSAR